VWALHLALGTVFLLAVRKWIDPATSPKPVIRSHGKPIALVMSGEKTKAEVIRP